MEESTGRDEAEWKNNNNNKNNDNRQNEASSLEKVFLVSDLRDGKKCTTMRLELIRFEELQLKSVARIHNGCKYWKASWKATNEEEVKDVLVKVAMR